MSQKIYLITLDEFLEAVNPPVYICILTNVHGEPPMREFDLVVTAWDRRSSAPVEYRVRVGHAHALDEDRVKKLAEKAWEILKMVKKRIEDEGLATKEGAISNSPVYGKPPS
jgi:hypothetical protein